MAPTSGSVNATTQTTTKSAKIYVEIAKSRSTNRMKHTYIPPEIVDGKPVVKYESIDVILPGINKWNSTAYGYVMGMNPSIRDMENFIKNQWSGFNFEEVFMLSSGFFLFKFKTDEDRDNMLSS
ncbi:hypothetical protein LIER_29290 [Lithospermum erythrorhizon]|uniref:DUF4283 domain-containing protein n=1 Tax=Lithospermum erythrorhizon TaxID=34254 RepID=A0AAV3RM81_LITER